MGRVMDERPRKRDKEASKQALMRAGLVAFSTHGYDAATTKLIAAEAGLNEQLITRYFGGKAGLLLTLVGAFVDEDTNERNYPPPAADVEMEIRQFLVHRHRRYLELQDFFRAFLPLSMRDASIRGTLETIVLRETAALRDRLLELQKHGLISGGRRLGSGQPDDRRAVVSHFLPAARQHEPPRRPSHAHDLGIRAVHGAGPGVVAVSGKRPAA